jgi:hypothetical protein
MSKKATKRPKPIDSDIELANRVDVAILTNNFRAVRGRPILCAIFDEIAFWRDENSATQAKRRNARRARGRR